MVVTCDPVVPMDTTPSVGPFSDVYSPDADRCLRGLRRLKNVIIGSNREKRSVIERGVVGRLLEIVTDKCQRLDVQKESLVVLTSLAKGCSENASGVVKCGVIPVVLERIMAAPPELAEASLKCLKSLAMGDPRAASVIFEDIGALNHLIGVIPKSHVTQEAVPVILGSACCKPVHQYALVKRGVIEKLVPLLKPLVPAAIHLAALGCVEKICRSNFDTSLRAVSTHGINNGLVALLSRISPNPTQLAAAQCVSAWHNAGVLGDRPALVLKAVALLIHLCRETKTTEVRIGATTSLAKLIQDDPELQYTAAISEKLIQELTSCLSSSDERLQESALNLYAALSASHEEVRKKVIEANVVTHILSILQPETTNPETALQSRLGVKEAAVCCLLSLSRSVFQLRTLFQTYPFWRLLRWFKCQAPNEDSQKLFVATVALLCNLSLQFSPCKEVMLEEGAIEILCMATKNTEDSSLKLNGIWSLMNLTFQADQATKAQVLSTLGTDQIFALLSDADERILLKTLGLLRNVLASKQHIDFFMNLYGRQIVQAVVLVSESDRSVLVKQQALCILANIADGDSAKDFIVQNEDVLKKLTAYLRHNEANLVKAAIMCVFNLVYTGCPIVQVDGDAEMKQETANERHKRLKEIGVYSVLQQLGNTTADPGLLEKVRETIAYFGPE